MKLSANRLNKTCLVYITFSRSFYSKFLKKVPVTLKFYEINPNFVLNSLKLPSYRNQSINLESKSIYWFLYHDKVGA